MTKYVYGYVNSSHCHHNLQDSHHNLTNTKHYNPLSTGTVLDVEKVSKY